MNYWLMKSEPDVFGIDDLAEMYPQSEPWDGVRNYQARNYMRDDMRAGDLAFLYHSSCKQPGVAGVMTVTRNAYPDHTSWNKKSKYYDPKSTLDTPRWFMVDVKFLRKFAQVVTLKELRLHAELSEMKLLQKGNRLSIMPLSKKEFEHILSLANCEL